jgi:hypothetical protein
MMNGTGTRRQFIAYLARLDLGLSNDGVAACRHRQRQDPCDPAIAAGIGQMAAIQGVAPGFGVELHPLGVSDAAEIERAVTAFARSSNGGLIITASPT